MLNKAEMIWRSGSRHLTTSGASSLQTELLRSNTRWSEKTSGEGFAYVSSCCFLIFSRETEENESTPPSFSNNRISEHHRFCRKAFGKVCKFSICSSVLLFLVLISTAEAAKFTVPSVTTPTLAAAVSLASVSGDVIEILPGIYSGIGFYGVVIDSKALTIIGATTTTNGGASSQSDRDIGGGGQVVIDCMYRDRCLVITGTARGEMRIIGVSFRNGVAPDPYSALYSTPSSVSPLSSSQPTNFVAESTELQIGVVKKLDVEAEKSVGR